MKEKLFLRIMIILIMSIFIISVSVETLAVTDPVTAMQNMAGAKVQDGSGGKIGNVINGAIGIIQVAGTGISMIMVTLLGIKYIMASPSDKADVKKQIAPMVIGAVILFASVNLVGIVAKVADTTLSSAAGTT